MSQHNRDNTLPDQKKGPVVAPTKQDDTQKKAKEFGHENDMRQDKPGVKDPSSQASKPGEPSRS